jgi:RHS repeat-associated protein
MGGPWMNDLTANDKPYQNNGKELESFGGLGWYDYGARFYDPSVGRLTSVDPLAEMYPGISPYAYVANNPIIFIDPDGMQIGDGKDVFNKFRDGVNDKISSLNSRAESLKSKAASALASGKDKKAARLTERAGKASASASSYGQVLSELNTLEASDQVYNIYTSSSDVGSGAGGNVQYDVGTDAVNVNIKDSYNAGALAHELKHAFQFETGALSFGATGKTGGSLYDLQDEVEAYARGSMFGYPLNPSLSDLKRDYSSISSRTTQLTLNTPTAAFSGALSLGQQLRARTARSFSSGKPAPEYYRDWKLNYK